MSGGSYDYVCYRISDAAEAVRASIGRVTEPVELQVRRDRVTRTYTGDDAVRLRAAIAAHRLWLADVLDAVSKAMHDVEWVDSCDYGEGDEVPAIAAIWELPRGPATPEELR